MNKEGKHKTVKVIGIIIGTIAFVLSYFGAQQLFKKDLRSELKEVALELNKQSPIPIDDYTRLDSATTKGATNFIYHYTLFDLDKSEVNIDTVNKYIRPGIIETVKNTPDLKAFRDNNIIMDYRYYDRNGALVTEISVTPDIYKEN